MGQGRTGVKGQIRNEGEQVETSITARRETDGPVSEAGQVEREREVEGAPGTCTRLAEARPGVCDEARPGRCRGSQRKQAINTRSPVMLFTYLRGSVLSKRPSNRFPRP